MPLTSIQKVRTLVGDMEKTVLNEVVGTGSATSKKYQVDLFPVATGSITVIISGAAINTASAVYNFDRGIIDLTGLDAGVTANATVAVEYNYFALSNDEIQSFIDLASGGGTLLAGSYAARALAGQTSRFFAYTQGSKKVDKDLISLKLLKLADSLEESYKNNINYAGISMAVATFDDSGTAFDGFDTGSSVLSTGISGGC